MSRFDIIERIHDNIRVRHEYGGVFFCQKLRHGTHIDIRVDCPDPIRSRLRLVRSHIVRCAENLTIQIRLTEHIPVDRRDSTDSHAG